MVGFLCFWTYYNATDYWNAMKPDTNRQRIGTVTEGAVYSTYSSQNPSLPVYVHTSLTELFQQHV